MDQTPPTQGAKVTIFRRSVRITGTAGALSADMEDDYHRFGVDLTHDGEKILTVRGRAIRTPWNTCRFAPDALKVLEGLPLQACTSDFIRQADPRAQCTHMYELAALAGSHALRGQLHADYAAAVPAPIGDDPARATLHRNGELLFDWQIRRPTQPHGDPHAPEKLVAGDVIVSPEPFAGRPLRSLLVWARDSLSPELFDAVYIFRRAIGISAARTMDLDAEGVDIAALLFSRKSGDCFTFQPEKLATTHRMRGSTLDFTARPDAPLGDLSKD
ncbi:MAG: DUF2889 domain-containing protein [Caulobacter sp.]|nr:DUF2889 domain-containing protein [Caulobacter sp.]